MSKPMLTVMMGLSGSGKSTVARTELATENTVIISSDDIRGEICGDVSDQSKNDEVFKLFHQRIRRNLEQKKDVIADATNLSMRSRRAILGTVAGLDVFKRCYLVPKPFELCLRDNKLREKVVPDEVLQKQIRRFQICFMEEGWDAITVDSRFGERDIDASIMRKFDQKNPHHTYDLYRHCRLAYLNFVNAYSFGNDYGTGAFLHDLGKMYCQTFDKNGVAHYYQHHCISGYCIISHYPKPYMLDSAFLANYHMMPFDWEKNGTHEKWKKRFGEEKYNALMAFHKCDLAAR